MTVEKALARGIALLILADREGKLKAEIDNLTLAFDWLSVRYPQALRDTLPDAGTGMTVMVLSSPITTLNASVRLFNCLHNIYNGETGIRTIGDLIQRTPRELTRFKNMGLVSVRELEGILAGMGLKLREEPEQNM